MKKLKAAPKYILYFVISVFVLATSLFLSLKSDISTIQEVSKFLASIAVVLGGLLYVRQPPSEIEEVYQDKNFRIAYLIITSGILFTVTYILSNINQLYPSYSMISAKAVLFMATWLFLMSSAEFSLHNMEKLKILNEKFQGL